jgi:hypothetical protein
VAAYVITCASPASGAPSSAGSSKALLEGMYRIFDTMSASEFQHVFSAVSERAGARQALKAARKQWNADHRYTGQ